MTNPPNVRNAWEKRHVKTMSVGLSRTQQHFADECDVNKIMEKYNRTGVLIDPLVPRKQSPSYGDFADQPDFGTAQNMLAAGKRAFEELPEEIKERFGNNPQKLMAFLENPQNREEAQRLGLVKETVKEAQKASVEETQAKNDEPAPLPT